MGVIKKQSIQNTIISYAGIALGYVNLVLLFPKFLPEEEVGLTRILLQVSVLYAQLSAIGFANVGTRFFPYFRDKEQKHHGFLTFLLGIPLLSFLLLTLLFFISKNELLYFFTIKYPKPGSELLSEYYFLIVPLALFTLYFNLFSAYLAALYKTVVPSFTNEVLLRVLITITIALYAFGWINFGQFVYMFVGVNCTVAIILAIYLFWLNQLKLPVNRLMFRIKPLKEMVYFGFFAFLGNVSTVILTTVDSLMILAYLGLRDVAIYTTAYSMSIVLLVPGRALYRVAIPKVADLWKENNLPEIQSLYRRVTRINLLIGCLLFLGVWCNVDNIYAIINKESYAEGKYVILFMSLAWLVELATSINAIILLNSPRFRYDLIFNITLAVLTIVTNYLLIPKFGINGAAFASMFTFMTVNILRLLYVYKTFKLQPFDLRSGGIILITFGVYYVNLIIPVLDNTFIDILLRSSVITIAYGGAILVFRIWPELNQKITDIVSKYL